MYDIITIGSCLVDSFIKSNEFKMHSSDKGTLICQVYGEKMEIDDYILRTGGGGSNTAVGFARMGFKTGIVSELGTDVLAHIILDNLKNESVSSSFIIKEKKERTGGAIILLGSDGGRTVMVHRGASSMLDPKDIPDKQIIHADWVHISSISGRLETLEHIFETMKKANKLFSWNPGKRELALIAEGRLSLKEVPCNIMFVNEEEWEVIKSRQADILTCVKQIIVTNGKKGGRVFVDGAEVNKFISGDQESVDDTGAGDAFVVGYITAYLKGKNIKESCDWGKKNAVSVIQHVGSKPGLLTIGQLK